MTNKSAPNDIDIILIMRDDFRQADYTEDVLPVFNHQRAQDELGASVFWTCQGLYYWKQWTSLLLIGNVHATLPGAVLSKSSCEVLL